MGAFGLEQNQEELSLLRDIQLAGEKSWQAKAWILERGYNWAQPSARLQVTQDHTWRSYLRG